MPQKIKQIAAVLIVSLLLFAAVWIAVPLLVDADKAKLALADIAQQRYGLTLKVEGAAKTQAFPAPAMSFSRISISDGDTLLATIPKAKVNIGWLGIFSDHYASMALTTPDIKLSQAQLRKLIKQHQTSSPSGALLGRLDINHARIYLAADERAISYLKNGITIADMSSSIILPTAAAPGQINITMPWRGETLSFKASEQAADKSVSGQFTIGTLMQVAFKGQPAPSRPNLWLGDIQFNANDLLPLTAYLSGNPQPAKSAATATPAAYPLSFNAKAQIDQNHLLIHRSVAKLRDVDTKIGAYVGWQDYINIGLELNPDTLQADQFVTSLVQHLLPEATLANGNASPLVTEILPSYVNMVLLTKTKEARIGNHVFNNLNVAAEFSDGDIFFHRATMAMAGDSRLNLEGTLKQLPEGQRFYGRAKVTGKHFNQWLATFEPLASKLPEEDFSNFLFHGNLFISKDQLRLSEADVKIGDLGFRGGFAAFFDQVPRVEADVRLQNINLDYFRNLANKESKNPQPQATSTIANFEWLRRLPAVLDFNVTIDGLTFLDSKGSLATARVYAKPGEISLNNMDIRLENNVINGNAALSVLGNVPDLNVAMSASRFNIGYFDAGKKSKPRQFFDLKNTKKRWSEELLNFDLLNSVNGRFDISVGTVVRGQDRYQNFKWQAVLAEQKLTIQNLAFSLFDGTFAMQGSLIGGSVPGVSASFTLYNADLGEIFSQLFAYDFISGRVSLSGLVGTSGISPRAWAEQSDIKLTAAARGVRVRNFNLQGLLDVSKEARSTKDVELGVRERLFDGVTEMSADGNVNIFGGVMKTPGIRLSYGRVLGSLVGEVDMLNWKTNLTSFWQFPELSSTTIPTMSITSQGDINDYKTRVDTSSLEAFVAKRIVGQ